VDAVGLPPPDDAAVAADPITEGNVAVGEPAGESELGAGAALVVNVEAVAAGVCDPDRDPEAQAASPTAATAAVSATGRVDMGRW